MQLVRIIQVLEALQRLSFDQLLSAAAKSLKYNYHSVPGEPELTPAAKRALDGDYKLEVLQKKTREELVSIIITRVRLAAPMYNCVGYRNIY
jgi:hypothetical protein